MDKIITYNSKEENETSIVTIQQINSSKVVEIEYTHKIDKIVGEYKKTKDKDRRKEMREEFKSLTQQINNQYKQPVYNETL